MEIPKAKVLIYMLTFLGYAWSGYGSSVITTLRDAVIAAENIFGDFLGKVSDIVSTIKHVHDTIDSSIQEDCTWSCPGGVKAVKNKYHRPTVNGCGPEMLKINDENMPYPQMTLCCDNHDLCYATCNSQKDKCDVDFKKCLYRVCDTYRIADTANQGCKAAAKVLYTATTALGCKFFQDAQAEACYCPLPKKKMYPTDEL
uniref:Group XIIA secretory phospholipase A2 n=1 Tax=Lygus hesperus TaxID=30085 RepID=A0A146M612_LYGHE